MQAFESNWIAPLGPNVDAFEKMVAERVGVAGSLALTSGTAGLHLALLYLGVGPGDCVFCSTLTFIGSCNAIAYLGAEAVFIDSEPESWNMSAEALEKAFDEAARSGRIPKAVIIVNIYGQSADMDRLLPICSKYNVPVIEDAAESLGARYKNKNSGSFGKFGVFSFNGNKIVTTSGGGMLVSDDIEAIEKCRFWSTQSREKARHYEHREIGYNYRMSNVLAGIGIGQIEQLDRKIEKKKSIYLAYKNAFSDIEEIEMMPVPEWSEPNYWLSVIQVEENGTVSPDDIMDALEAAKIESRPAWKPMHLQPVFRKCRYYTHFDNKSVSDKIYKKGVCLPSGSGMDDESLERVISCIRSLFRHHRGKL